jgi:hypothetical protein
MHASVLKIKNGPLRLAEVKRGERPRLFARVVPSRSVLLEAAGVYARVFNSRYRLPLNRASYVVDKIAFDARSEIAVAE